MAHEQPHDRLVKETLSHIGEAIRFGEEGKMPAVVPVEAVPGAKPQKSPLILKPSHHFPAGQPVLHTKALVVEMQFLRLHQAWPDQKEWQNPKGKSLTGTIH